MVTLESALADVQDQKIKRISNENEKLQKENELLKSEITKIENLFELVAKPMEVKERDFD